MEYSIGSQEKKTRIHIEISDV